MRADNKHTLRNKRQAHTFDVLAHATQIRHQHTLVFLLAPEKNTVFRPNTGAVKEVRFLQEHRYGLARATVLLSEIVVTVHTDSEEKRSLPGSDTHNTFKTNTSLTDISGAKETDNASGAEHSLAFVRGYSQDDRVI
jgi:hypothetical protein